jgi:hypothetical protein
MRELTAAVMVLLVLVSTLALANGNNEWNLAAPTMGGKQLWRDSHVYAGWRIQENLLTGHFPTARHGRYPPRLGNLRAVPGTAPAGKGERSPAANRPASGVAGSRHHALGRHVWGA